MQEVLRARPMGIEASLCDAASRDVGMLPMIEIMGWRLHCPVGTESLHWPYFPILDH
jgi:hypothetical protein